jgi:D-xylose transport system ATP-binding protein
MSRPSDDPPRLEARGVSKHFGGVKVLDDVDLDVRASEVHAVCGENGAGKSTLIKVFSGVHPFGSYGGTIRVDGREARFGSPRDARHAGIAVIHQELALVEGMSVTENLFLGDLPRRGPFVDWPRLVRDASELLSRFELDLDPEAPVGSLGVGRKQQVEILKAVRTRSRVLILDEPTAALGEAEASRLLELVRQLAREGVGCVYITHRLDEVRAIADRVTVLRDGRTVAAFPTGAVAAGELIRAMAGRPVCEAAPRRSLPRDGPCPALLDVSGLEVAPRRGRPARLSGISFEVRAGEVVGLAGLMGSGRSELLMHVYGSWGVRTAGSVRLLGEPHDDPTPRTSLTRGLALVSEDRRRFGLVPDRSVEFNLTLSALKRISRGGLLDTIEEGRMYRATAEALRVRAAGPERPIRSLSGGNQQKVLLGRALLSEPRVILLDEPTRGVDVATKFEIYDLINRLTEQGRAVLLVTSELPELLGLSDRLLILRAGRLVLELPRERFDQGRVLEAALGHDSSVTAAEVPR